ncbi:MFS transporter [Amycolatopsis sp. H20-H5]|uniref:MFS transporter n=1 Tax=Amycolatopsis sp. H20-H5 TaxID=3046309 RepID=UPI003FA34A89
MVFIAGAAAVGGFLFGYDSSNINGAVIGIRQHFEVGEGITGLTVSSALIGSSAGAWFGGLLSDRIGRIRTMQLAAVLFLVSAIGAMFPFAIWDLALWRVVGGIAIGVASVIGPAYIAEVAPPAYRGPFHASPEGHHDSVKRREGSHQGTRQSLGSRLKETFPRLNLAKSPSPEQTVGPI